MREHHTPEAIKRLQDRLTRLLVQRYADPEAAPVLAYRSRQELLDQFAEPHPPKSGSGFDATFAELEHEILPASVNTWHPLFLNQMNAGAPVPAIVGDAIASMMNSTMATWEMTPVATILERNVAGWLAELVGMPAGSGGILLPGGSIANLLALAVARNKRLDATVQRDGVAAAARPGVIVCSEASHYSVKNAANLLGIGTANLVRVAVSERGEMLTDDSARKLDAAVAAGKRPFAVVATVGVTVTGGVDPLAEIAAICRERDLHLHVDAAFGGTLALTAGADSWLAGIELADTVLWDAHKWLHVPLSCSALLAPDPQVLKDSLSSDAGYLFHEPRDGAGAMTEDLGRYTLMCGKRFDALQVWVMLRALGVDYFRGLAERSLALTRGVYDKLVSDPDFEPCYEPVTPIVCFRYGDDADGERSDALHVWVREEIKRRGLGMFNIARVGGRESFRLVLINPLTELRHIETLLEDIRTLAQQKRRG